MAGGEVDGAGGARAAGVEAELVDGVLALSALQITTNNFLAILLNTTVKKFGSRLLAGVQNSRDFSVVANVAVAVRGFEALRLDHDARIRCSETPDLGAELEGELWEWLELGDALGVGLGIFFGLSVISCKCSQYVQIGMRSSETYLR